MNANLPRWLMSSLAKHFKTVADTIPLNYYVEGIDDVEITDFQTDSALFKMDGPVVHQGSAIDEWYDIELIILLTDIVQSGENPYEIYRWAGIFESSLINDALSIFRFGTGVEDDGTLIGCLTPDTRLRNNVRVVNYGQTDKDLHIRQMSVNGRFLLFC